VQNNVNKLKSWCAHIIMYIKQAPIDFLESDEVPTRWIL
jgi:hypothetical protein